MGWDAVYIADVHARVSRRNSERDISDNKLADELQREIQAVVDQPKYREIGAENNISSLDWHDN